MVHRITPLPKLRFSWPMRHHYYHHFWTFRFHTHNKQIHLYRIQSTKRRSVHYFPKLAPKYHNTTCPLSAAINLMLSSPIQASKEMNLAQRVLPIKWGLTPYSCPSWSGLIAKSYTWDFFKQKRGHQGKTLVKGDSINSHLNSDLLEVQVAASVS